MLKRWAMLLVVVVMLQLTPVAMAQSKIDEGLEKTDIVLLMDTSGSMKSTDRNNLIKDAVKLMADLATLADGDFRLGFVGYSDQVTASFGLVSAEDTVALAQLKAAIDQVNYYGSTDLSAGLNGAVALFNDQPDRKRIVILLSDGVAYSEDKSDAQKTVVQQLDQALAQAKAKSIVVDTVAVKQSVAEQSNLLFNIADQTGGTIYTAQSDQEINTVYAELIKAYYQPNLLYRGQIPLSKGTQQLELSLPTDAFADVQLVLTANQTISGVKIFAQAEKLLITEEPHYASVQMKGTKGQNFSLVMQSKAPAEATLSIYLKSPIIQNVTQECQIADLKTAPKQLDTLKVQLTQGSKSLTNHPYLTAMSATFQLVETETGEVVKIPAVYKDGALMAQHQFAKFGHYELTTILSGTDATIETGKADVTISDQVSSAIAQVKAVKGQRIMLVLVIIACLGLIYLVVKMRRRSQAQIAAIEEDARRLYFTGKLNGYIINTKDDDDDVPPITEYLHRHLEKSLTLQDIIQGANISLALKGAENIIFRPGPKHNLIVRNNSNCTIIKSHEIVERNKEALVEYDEKMYITFEDQQYEMELYYKNSKF